MQPVFLNQRLPDTLRDAGQVSPAAATSRHGNAKCTVALIASLMIGFLTCMSLGCAPIRSRLVQASSIATENLVNVEMVQRDTPIPSPSNETELLLREYQLTQLYDQDPDTLVKLFQEHAQPPATMEEIHGLVEIAELQAQWSDAAGESQLATRLYFAAVVHAYKFLFDPQLNIESNAYDPQFRNICEIYNRSLEGLLRKVVADDEFGNGKKILIEDGEHGIELEIQIAGRWRDQHFTSFEFVSDYEVSGIDKHLTHGLGVPLIAVRRQQVLRSASDVYYPSEITMPMTALLQFSTNPSTELNEPIQPIEPELKPHARSRVRQAVLKLYDPLEQTMVNVESRMVPLESDLTTPLAYGLRDPYLNKELMATELLLDAESAPWSHGLFLLEPYDPEKIPVVMVHGFWSSPVTWVHMFNDLRANRDIRENCQFWFYSYPTGLPYWISAEKLRNDLAEIRQDVDPLGNSKPLDQMVLVGHSMGGLMSVMQTIDSGDKFWDTISEYPIGQFDGDPATIEKLRDTFYFRPNRSVARVITLATPFRGSEFSNLATRFFSKKLFALPPNDIKEFANQNEGKLDGDSSLTTLTSIDSLAPGHPVLDALDSARQATSVTMHNIVGRLERKSFLKSSGDTKLLDSDGVVSVESATNELAVSSKFVPEEHSDVHQHPEAISEVRRILLKHLAEHKRIRPRESPNVPVVRHASDPATDGTIAPGRTVAEDSGGLRLSR